MKGLAPMQRAFVGEYLVDLNATEAAKRAGYSPKTAKQQGARLLTNVDVQAALQAAMARREARTAVTQDRVLEEVAAIGFAKITDVVRWGMKEVAFGYDDDGKRLPPDQLGDAAMVRYEWAPFLEPLNSDDLPEHVKAAISEVAMTKDGLKIKMHGKTEALNLAGRHLGMWNDKIDVHLKVSMAQRILEAREHVRITRAA